MNKLLKISLKYNVLPCVITLGIICTLMQMQRLSLAKSSKVEYNQKYYEKLAFAEQANLALIEKLPALGFDNLIADWTVLRFIQYFGNKKARQATDYSLSIDFFKVLVKRDPNFTSAYFRLAPAVTLKAARPEETVKIIGEGLAQISPERYRSNYLWVYKAIDELLFLGDTEAAIKSFQTAAEWSRIIDDTPREKSALRTAQFLATDPDSKTVQVGAWFNIWTNAPDLETRKLAQRNIESLGGKLEITEDGRVFAHPPQEKRS